MSSGCSYSTIIRKGSTTYVVQFHRYLIGSFSRLFQETASFSSFLAKLEFTFPIEVERIERKTTTTKKKKKRTMKPFHSGRVPVLVGGRRRWRKKKKKRNEEEE